MKTCRHPRNGRLDLESGIQAEGPSVNKELPHTLISIYYGRTAAILRTFRGIELRTLVRSEANHLKPVQKGG